MPGDKRGSGEHKGRDNILAMYVTASREERRHVPGRDHQIYANDDRRRRDLPGHRRARVGQAR